MHKSDYSKRSYTIAFKRAAIKHFELTNSKRKTSINLQLPRSCLINWIKDKDQIMNPNSELTKKRVISKNLERAHFYESESRIYSWFKDQRANSISVTPVHIRNKMLEDVIENTKDVNFKASNGWMLRFMNRFNLVNRRISSRGRPFDLNTEYNIREYLNQIDSFIKQHDLKPWQIFNFDETSFYMDTPGQSSLSKRGTKEKTRLSCLCTGTAFGGKLPILAVLPIKEKIESLEHDPNFVVIYETKGTFTCENLIEHYIGRVLKPYLIQKQIKKGLVIMDKAPPHLPMKFTQALKQNGLEIVYIPASLTGILQPSEVCWYKLLKSEFIKKWNEWFLNEPKTITAKGNVAGPGYVKMLSWISGAWVCDINSDLIKESFTSTGITSTNTADFHLELKNILENHTLPYNSTIEEKTDEDYISGIFVNDYDDENSNSGIDGVGDGAGGDGEGGEEDDEVGGEDGDAEIVFDNEYRFEDYKPSTENSENESPDVENNN